jgi:ParB-like chromosome segregation protein Spo0J
MPIKKLIKIDKIIPNDKNPRLIKNEEYIRLKESIQEFPEMMELKPIVVNKSMVIIGGHQRYKIYKELNIIWI